MKKTRPSYRRYATAILLAIIGNPLAQGDDITHSSVMKMPPMLGPVPEPYPPGTIFTYTDKLHQEEPSRAQTTFSKTGDFNLGALDDRQLSREFYRSVYLSPEDVDIGWTGAINPDTNTCNAGTTSPDFQDATLVRINTYRAFAGVHDNILFDGSQLPNPPNGQDPHYDGDLDPQTAAQESSMMMNAAHTLSHTPLSDDSNWACGTYDGDIAAGVSNLSLGNFGYDAVMSQVRDAGPNNSVAGHRRWLLYPQSRYMVTGDTNQYLTYTIEGHVDEQGDPIIYHIDRANTIWVQDGNTWNALSGGDMLHGFIAWPPPGYVPYPIVYPRWSFSLQGASFTSAAVTVCEKLNPGTCLPIEYETKSSSIGHDDAIVWVPGGLNEDSYDTTWPNPGSDITYTVTISGVSGSGQSVYSYDVTIFDPDQPGASDSTYTITGDTYITTTGSSFSHDVPAFSVYDYELREITTQTSTTHPNGAESGDPSDYHTAGYDLRVLGSGYPRSGSYAYHLTHPSSENLEDQYFVLDKKLLLNSGAEISFYYRMGFAKVDQTLNLEISTDDGATWATLETIPGEGLATPSLIYNLVTHDVDNIYIGKIAKLRFSYKFPGSGSYSIGTAPYVGFLIDDIAVSSASEVTITQEPFSIGDTGQFSYEPSGPGLYGIHVRARPWQGFDATAWGDIHYVWAEQTTCVNSGTDLKVTQTMLDDCKAEGTRSFSGTSSLYTDAGNTVTIPSDGFPWSFTSDGTITLNPGFTAINGSDFSATIVP